jgi:hypothetical protein
VPEEFVDVSIWDTVFPSLTWDEYNALPAEVVAARIAFKTAATRSEDLKFEAKKAVEEAKAKSRG